MKHSFRKFTRRLGCFLKWLPVLIVLMAGGFIIYLSTAGFPYWLVEKIRLRLNAGQMYMEIDEIKLDYRRGIIIEDLYVYRDSVMGPPAFEIAETVVVPDVTALLSGRLPVKKAIANGVVVRPEMATGESSAQEPQYNTFGEFRLEMNNVDMLGFHMGNASCLMWIDGPEIRVTDAVFPPRD